jgi:protoheme ferro-lyase
MLEKMERALLILDLGGPGDVEKAKEVLEQIRTALSVKRERGSVLPKTTKA